VWATDWLKKRATRKKGMNMADMRFRTRRGGNSKHNQYGMIKERERNISYRIVFRLIRISLFLKDNLYSDALLNLECICRGVHYAMFS
jgi:hypothetical protein